MECHGENEQHEVKYKSSRILR